jgi:hypothetical protein
MTIAIKVLRLIKGNVIIQSLFCKASLVLEPIRDTLVPPEDRIALDRVSR